MVCCLDIGFRHITTAPTGKYTQNELYISYSSYSRCTVEHFLLRCPALASVRNPIIDNILSVGAGIYSPTNSPVSFLQLILDHSALNCYISDGSHGQLHSIEFHCRRLCHALHTERYKLLSIVPKRQRKGAKKRK